MECLQCLAVTNQPGTGRTNHRRNNRSSDATLIGLPRPNPCQATSPLHPSAAASAMQIATTMRGVDVVDSGTAMAVAIVAEAANAASEIRPPSACRMPRHLVEFRSDSADLQVTRLEVMQQLL